MYLKIPSVERRPSCPELIGRVERAVDLLVIWKPLPHISCLPFFCSWAHVHLADLRGKGANWTVIVAGIPSVTEAIVASSVVPVRKLVTPGERWRRAWRTVVWQWRLYISPISTEGTVNSGIFPRQGTFSAFAQAMDRVSCLDYLTHCVRPRVVWSEAQKRASDQWIAQ